MDGVMILDKPASFTSFDVVAVMRGLCRQRKAGHTGTLDPMATGVLPILLGKATRALPFLPDTDKQYQARFVRDSPENLGSDRHARADRSGPVPVPGGDFAGAAHVLRGTKGWLPAVYLGAAGDRGRTRAPSGDSFPV